MNKTPKRSLGKVTIFFFVCLQVGSLGLAGCSIKFQPFVRPPIYEPEIPLFRYEKERLQPQVSRIAEEESYWVEKVNFSSALEPYQVTAYHYHPKTQDNLATIIIMPILGGTYYLSKDLAQYLVEEGFTCLRFERMTDPLDAKRGLRHIERCLRYAVIDLRRAIDWLVEGNGRDPNRIGVVGISMGAITAALALGVERRIGAAAIILGGGDIATILTTSTESDVVRFRQDVMEAGGLSLEQFHMEATRLMTPVDPLTYAPRTDPKQILMVNAYFDQVIPYDCSERLWEAMGRPLSITLPTGHYTGALYLWYIRYRIFIHFRECFGMEKGNRQRDSGKS